MPWQGKVVKEAVQELAPKTGRVLESAGSKLWQFAKSLATKVVDVEHSVPLEDIITKYKLPYERESADAAIDIVHGWSLPEHARNVGVPKNIKVLEKNVVNLDSSNPSHGEIQVRTKLQGTEKDLHTHMVKDLGWSEEDAKRAIDGDTHAGEIGE